MAQHLFRAARSTGHSIEVYNMEGGLFQWAMEGRELVDSTERTTSLVHPYSVVFGKLLPQNLRAAL